MSARRHAVAIALLAGASAAILFTNTAWAQGYEGEAVPPPPPEGDDAQPGMPPADALPPAQAPDENTFEQNLSPYGRWVDTPEYGRVWVPSDTGPDWQPYTDGHWVDTDWGWSFASSVPWGWAAFHYGRWGFGPGLGWFWVPGFVWSPAWVSWRYYPGFVCWSPFAPSGFVFGRSWPGWVVLPGVHFTRPIARFRIPRTHSGPIVRAANPVAAIASRAARANFRGAGSSWGNGNVRQGGAVRGGGNVRAGGSVRGGARGFSPGTFRSGGNFRSSGTFRSSSNAGGSRSSFAGGASRAWSSGGGRTFAGVTHSAPAASHAFARRR
jgi:uncharacterized protein DUF6600